MTICAQAGPGGGAATGKLRPLQGYHRPGDLSTTNLTADALGYLLLYLLGRPLPPEECVLGWRLVRKWAGQLVEARLEEAA